MQILTIDFETYYASDFSLSKLTTEAYIKDPRFQVIGFSIKVNGGLAKWYTGTHKELKEVLDYTVNNKKDEAYSETTTLAGTRTNTTNVSTDITVGYENPTSEGNNGDRPTNGKHYSITFNDSFIDSLWTYSLTHAQQAAGGSTGGSPYSHSGFRNKTSSMP